MKKYFVSFLALVLAIGFSAFKADFSPVSVYFQGNPQVEAQVEDPAQWTVSSISCATSGNAACTFVIDNTYINTSATPDALRTDLTIVAEGNAVTGFNPLTVKLGVSADLKSSEDNRLP